jgi:hypothetical protein
MAWGKWKWIEKVVVSEKYLLVVRKRYMRRFRTTKILYLRIKGGSKVWLKMTNQADGI